MAQKSIADICDISLGYSFREKPVIDENGKFYLLQAKDINAYGEIDYSQCVKISTDNIKSINPLSQGEILFSNRGSFKAALFESEKPFVTSNSLFILKIKERARNICDKRYLAIWLNSSTCKRQIEKMSLFSTTVANLPKNALDKLKIDLPDIELQKIIAEAYIFNNKQMQLQEKIYNLRKIQLENIINGVK